MKIQNSERSHTEQVGLDSSRLLSEAEACSLAGITHDTLKSYTQFSLLKPVIRNQKPFYRVQELKQLFNLAESPSDSSVPTLDKLLSPEQEPEELTAEIQEAKSPEPEIEEKNTSAEVKHEPQSSNLPAVRVEDVLLQNQALNTRIKSLEDERDWLRRRVEMLEERSAREQMLMLKEKETLSEIINVTLVKERNQQKFSFSNYIKRLALPFLSSNSEK